MRKIFWASDSTVQTNKFMTYPQTGIGQVFSLYTKDDVTVVNYAKNGRSTKSFIDEGRLQRIDEEIGAGDFLFIQFGHNDEKSQDLLDIQSLFPHLWRIWRFLSTWQGSMVLTLY